MSTKIRFHLLGPVLAECVALLLIAGCSDSTAPEGQTGMYVLTAAILPARAVVATELSPSPTFIVLDKHRRPMGSGIPVTFAVAGGGSTTPTNAVTGPDGTVSTIWTLGSQPGLNTLSASVGSSITARYDITTVAAGFAALVPIKGDLQRGGAGSDLPAPLQAKAIDAYGNPIGGVPVTFSVPSGGGSIDATTVLTNDSGIATSGSWTLGSSSGVQWVLAKSSSVDASFQADSFTCRALTSGSCSEWGQLVFVQESDGQIYQMAIDGTGLRRLTTRGPNFEFASSPRWSPDGTRIAFVQNMGNYDLGWDTNIYIMNADGSNVVQLTHDAVSSEPSWSPDGRRLIFSRVGPTGTDLYAVSVDDATAADLVAHNGHAAEWSPDGRRIAFLRGTASYSASNGNTVTDEVYTMNPDSTDLAQVTSAQTNYSSPRWSPDGSRIATANCTLAGCFVDVVNVNGSGVSTFGVQSGKSSEPSWSRDGKWILLTVRDTGSTLEYIPTAGGSPRVVLQGASAGSWRP